MIDCNRTYYAASGESYRLLVNWPKPTQLPFLCYLTFSSATHDPSELLQVSLRTDVSLTRCHPKITQYRER